MLNFLGTKFESLLGAFDTQIIYNSIINWIIIHRENRIKHGFLRGINCMEKKEFKSFMDMINHLDLKILEYGYLYADSNWNYEKVSSPFSRLYLITSGKGYIENYAGSIVLEPGMAYLIPSHTTYNYCCPNKMEKFYIHFRLEYLPGQDLFEGCAECKSRPISEEWAHELASKANSHQLDNLIYCKSLLLRLIGMFVTCLEEDKYLPFIKNIMKYKDLYEYIENNCYADITVSCIASHMNVSSSTLSKNFKQDTGDTIKNYIHKKLIQKAKDYLLLSDLSVKEISCLLRFSDPFYFSRFFKKHTGMSPMQYKKQNKM